MLEKPSRSLPLWIEGVIVITLLTMGVVEFLHEQVIWSAIFGISGIMIGISLVTRLKAGDSHGP